MPKSKSRGKAYSPKSRAGQVKLRAQPWKIHAVFEPVEAILDEIELSGMVSVTEEGKPIFSELAHNDVYEFVPSLCGLIDAFDLHAERNALPIVTNALKTVCVKLDKGQMLDQFDLAGARESIAALKKQSGDMEADYAYRLIRDIQIKFELEAQQERAQLREAA
ncbi:hypothetical protein LMG22037_05513 [Paraburkholderia phenoliruptrix]|uniref:Uncharacterized protein n=1 Tax=Paraburkholderia phenoliruptrix TaxID=252970 RepID=A0A6J5C856_9BURK|nr:hypothetical protein [Paraburkholderia phenoliruptrix]CAB3730187.1 hypothetical protein LMG22037_05513 [Paraburkholderia phenoliruptrix]